MNDAVLTSGPTRHECPRCGSCELFGRHCKLLCPGCGYVESCEDLFPKWHGVCGGDDPPSAAGSE
jgi:hypothetical protein